MYITFRFVFSQRSYIIYLHKHTNFGEKRYYLEQPIFHFSLEGIFFDINVALSVVNKHTVS